MSIRGKGYAPHYLVRTATPIPRTRALTVFGELDVSVVSAVEYARNAGAYHLLPDIALSCDGPVRSVALFSQRPVEELDGRTVLVSASSRTSVHLLELLCHDVWEVRPVLVEVRAEAQDLDELGSATRLCCWLRAGTTRTATIWVRSGRR